MRALHVAAIKTPTGIYKCPITKLALLLLTSLTMNCTLLLWFWPVECLVNFLHYLLLLFFFVKDPQRSDKEVSNKRANFVMGPQISY